MRIKLPKKGQGNYRPDESLHIKEREIQPGDIIDGQWIGIPEYYRLSHIEQAPQMQRAVLRYAIDSGTSGARERLRQVNRRLKAVCRLLAREGKFVYVHSVDQWLAVELWVSGSPIFDRTETEAHIVHPFGPRADVWLRRFNRACQKHAAKRAEKQRASAEAYLAALPADLVILARTARPECIRLSRDGKTLTEALHDVGGSMSCIVGCNGFVMPDSLAEMQATHDSVYHPRTN